MSTESDAFFLAMLATLPEGWRVVDGPHENLSGRAVVYVAPAKHPGLRVRVQVEAG